MTGFVLVTQGELDDLTQEIHELREMLEEINTSLEASAKRIPYNPYFNTQLYPPIQPAPYVYNISSGSYST